LLQTGSENKQISGGFHMLSFSEVLHTTAHVPWKGSAPVTAFVHFFWVWIKCTFVKTACLLCGWTEAQSFNNIFYLDLMKNEAIFSRRHKCPHDGWRHYCQRKGSVSVTPTASVTCIFTADVFLVHCIYSVIVSTCFQVEHLWFKSLAFKACARNLKLFMFVCN